MQDRPSYVKQTTAMTATRTGQAVPSEVQCSALNHSPFPLLPLPPPYPHLPRPQPLDLPSVTQAYNPGLISADSGGQQQNDVTSLVRKLRDAEAAFCVLDEQHQKLSSAQKPQPKSMASRPGYRKPTLSPAALQMPGSARSEGAETLPRLVSPGGIPPSENPDGVTVRLGTLLAISYHNIAVEQEHVGEYAKCKSTYRIAFLTAEDFLGPDHPLPIQFRSSYQQALRSWASHAVQAMPCVLGGGTPGGRTRRTLERRCWDAHFPCARAVCSTGTMAATRNLQE